MTLYEIDRAIENCVDMETGEVINIEALEQLQMDRANKIESVALWVKNLTAEAEALKAEKDAFAARQKAAENKIASLKRYLTDALGGEKFSTARCAVSFRPSTSVEVDEDALPKKFFARKVVLTPDKNAIKDLLKQGKKIKGARLVSNLNPQIK